MTNLLIRGQGFFGSGPSYTADMVSRTCPQHPSTSDLNWFARLVTDLYSLCHWFFCKADNDNSADFGKIDTVIIRWLNSANPWSTSCKKKLCDHECRSVTTNFDSVYWQKKICQFSAEMRVTSDSQTTSNAFPLPSEDGCPNKYPYQGYKAHSFMISITPLRSGFSCLVTTPV